MADQRSLSFGVRFGTDTAPLDELNEKQKQVQEEAERTAEELEQIGIIKRENIADSFTAKVKKAYPAYFGTYKEFGKVRGYLDSFDNLYCIGRNGQHRYNNMDHSMMTAMVAVDHIATGNNDKSEVWSVNTEEEYHESK